MAQHKVLQAARWTTVSLQGPSQDQHELDQYSFPLPACQSFQRWGGVGWGWAAVRLVASCLDEILGRMLSSACQWAGTACVSDADCILCNNTTILQIWCCTTASPCSPAFILASAEQVCCFGFNVCFVLYWNGFVDTFQYRQGESVVSDASRRRHQSSCKSLAAALPLDS